MLSLPRNTKQATSQKIYFITPKLKTCGGVVKIFDYLTHALELGLQPIVCAEGKYKWYYPLMESSLLKIPQFHKIERGESTPFLHPKDLCIKNEDLVFFSWPPDFKLFEHSLPDGFPVHRIIHLIQDGRYADPSFLNGYALELLSKSFSLLVVSHPIMEAIRPHINPNSFNQLCPLGHNTEYFFKQRSGGFKEKIRVAYTTWKSDLGDYIAHYFKNRSSSFQFKCCRGATSWKKLRRLYHWADVFLATPNKEEGFYLPGLEAMAAGNIVITPDAGGNREYCRFGENCIYVKHENKESYIQALEELPLADSNKIESIRSSAYNVLPKYSLKREKDLFNKFLKHIAKSKISIA
jgi:hypothetical protein